MGEVEDHAELQLADVVPTSVSGVVALLDYAAGIEDGIGFREIHVSDEEPGICRSWYYFALRNVTEALRTIAAWGVVYSPRGSCNA